MATSAVGHIVTLDGAVSWLHTAGNPEADLRDILIWVSELFQAQ